MAASEPVRKEIFINAPPEHVFPYFTDASRMIEWMGETADLDARPGGIFRVDVNGGMVARGEYVEVVPNSRLVFTWGWEDDDEEMSPGSTRVEVTLEDRDGGTLLQLAHFDIPESRREGHDYNWGYFLERLEAVAEGRMVE